MKRFKIWRQKSAVHSAVLAYARRPDYRAKKKTKEFDQYVKTSPGILSKGLIKLTPRRQYQRRYSGVPCIIAIKRTFVHMDQQEHLQIYGSFEKEE